MMEWGPKYSVKIKEMDKQHKQVIKVINKLYSFEKGADREELKKIFDMLIEYISRHFHAEEELMRRYEYPGYPEQKLAHDAFIDRICAYQKSFLKNEELAQINVFNFIWDWFVNHVAKVDQKYSPYLTAHMK